MENIETTPIRLPKDLHDKLLKTINESESHVIWLATLDTNQEIPTVIELFIEENIHQPIPSVKLRTQLLKKNIQHKIRLIGFYQNPNYDEEDFSKRLKRCVTIYYQYCSPQEILKTLDEPSQNEIFIITNYVNGKFINAIIETGITESNILSV